MERLKPLSTTEYAACVWSPHYNYAINKIEAIQGKFTKGLNGCIQIVSGASR